MLIVCRTKAPRRELTVIGSQYQRVRRVEMPVKMGCSRRSASPWLVLPGMRSAVETESAVRKCSLAVIGEVSALASRNQVMVNLDVLQALLKTCVEFPILEFMREFNLLESLEITEESIFSQLGTSLPIHGYKFKGIKKNQNEWIIQVEDIWSRDPELFVKDVNAFIHPILMLRHNGINAKIEFFDMSGKSVKKLYIQVGDNK